MATEKQIAANRQNALLSKGPRSLPGKCRSSQNAVRHGLTATQTMLPGEDSSEFAGLRGAMFSSLKPEGALENQLVERAASLIWRMRRIQAFEVALFQWTAHYQAEQYDDPIDIPDGTLRNDPDGVEPHPELRDGLTVGRMVEALLSADLTSKLSRYETSMLRQLSQTIKDLLELQRPRREFEEKLEKERAKEKAKSGPRDPHYEHALRSISTRRARSSSAIV